MGKGLSDDLRVRVVAAVEAGTSRRQAAARFGVSVSSAVRWVAPDRKGGDRRSGRIEAQAGFLLGQVERRPDVTLAELQALPFERGVAVGRCEHAFQIVGKARGTGASQQLMRRTRFPWRSCREVGENC